MASLFKIDISHRISLLKKLRNAILEYEEKIVEALHKDLHKSKEESYITEIGLCLKEIRYHCSELKTWCKVKKVSSPWLLFPFSSSFIQYEPLGCVLIISPFNYPFQLSMMPLIGAISAGNRVVIKPSELSTHTSIVMQEMIEKYFHKNDIQVVLGGVEETQSLLKEKFDHIFFTGSTPVGKIIMQEAAKQLTPVTLELGGKSPCIVDENCCIDTAASRIVYGKFLNAGQTCIAPDYLLLHTSIKDILIEKMKKKIHNFYYKENQLTSFGKMISQKHYQRLKSYLTDVTIVHEGGIFSDSEEKIWPTLVEVKEDHPLLQEEIFGPILPIITFNNIETVISFIKNKSKPLACYVFSSDEKFQENILQEISAGGFCINDTLSHVINHHLPFGGVSESGFGRYHGKYTFELFSNQKSIFRNTKKLELGLKFPPYSNFIFSLIKKLLN